ncbi:unnamed protein product [Paramecium pentaurelia]|uniref:Uncharacterized protein n=1 Tax=Paramecium pentaurelia TaxID=43138 RepID=A0A8S1WMC9_9CILI|nr:unnamed protein product [Paramecium pentaurelia]
MLQNQKPIQCKNQQQNPKTRTNQSNQSLIQKPKKQTQQQIQIIQQVKSKNSKPSFVQYFMKPVIYNIILFLNFKEISSLRRVNSYFNQIFIECLPILKQYYNEQLNIQKELIQSNIIFNQLPQLNHVDFDEFKSGLYNEFLYACPEKVPQFYIKCIELISKVLLSELPKWRYSKYTYQMKTKLLYEKLQMKEPLENLYDLSDIQVEIIRSEAHNIDNGFTFMKCQFVPLVNFVDNLIILSNSPHYKELKKYKQIQHRILEIQKFLNAYFKNQ